MCDSTSDVLYCCTAVQHGGGGVLLPHVSCVQAAPPCLGRPAWASPQLSGAVGDMLWHSVAGAILRGGVHQCCVYVELCWYSCSFDGHVCGGPTGCDTDVKSLEAFHRICGDTTASGLMKLCDFPSKLLYDLGDSTFSNPSLGSYCRLWHVTGRHYHQGRLIESVVCQTTQ